MTWRLILICLLAAVLVLSCGRESGKTAVQSLDPNKAPKASIDRFSMAAGTLQVRSAGNGLPGPNMPVDFDRVPFITRALGPGGEFVQYYNFDVQPLTPAPIYVLFREGESKPVPGQLNIIDVIPGDERYNDFWRVMKVTVPPDYKANTVTSLKAIMDADYLTETTDMLVNCPVVPDGSTATLRLGNESHGLTRGWYRNMVVTYFTFSEKKLMTTPEGEVPVSPIYVCFNMNPDPNNSDSGPASGFKTEPGSDQTHNVASTLPPEPGYSPLWVVSVYDNADFDMVHDLSSVKSAHILASGVATPNCPIVSIESMP
jgi:hypothetical protein